MFVAPRDRLRALRATILSGVLVGIAPASSSAVDYFQDATIAKGIVGAYTTAGVTADVSEVRGGGAAVFDYDNDGDEDLYVTNNADRPNELYRNDGGTFVNVAAFAGVAYAPRTLGALAADLDNDGDSDLMLLNDGADVLYRNEGNGKFTNRTGASGFLSSLKTSYSAAVADYDLDGDLDVYIAHWSENPVAAANALWRNEGELRFVEVTATAGVGDPEQSLATIWHDLDVDGDPDLMSINEYEHDMVYRNEGNGTFADVTFDVLFEYNDVFYADGMGVHIADVDRDGLQDIYVTNFGKNNLYMGQGDGTWLDEAVDRGCSGPLVLPRIGWGVEFFDCELDGDLDIYVVNGHMINGSSDDDLYVNNGTGNFTAAPNGGGTNENYVGRGLVLSDFDGDGDQDMFVVNHNNPTQAGLNCYYENLNATPNHWLHVRTRGIVSNAEGVGARVIVEGSGGAEWVREVTIGSSFASSSSPTLTFGLGSRTTVDLRVEWPSGIVDDINGISVDRTVVVVEGEDTVVDVAETITPARPRLVAFPNPARRASTIALDLAASAEVRLSAYTASGRLVHEIYSGVLPAGSHELGWDGRSSDGTDAAPGVYFLRLEESGRIATTRMVKLD
jgi:hypothetical protein